MAERKGRSSGGAIRFSEDELLQIQARVRGVRPMFSTATPPVDGKSNTGVISTTQSFDTSSSSATKSNKKSTSKRVTPSAATMVEDPDWTAPRTAKIANPKGKRKSVNVHVAEVIQAVKESTVRASLSDRHFTLVFDGARLLTLNEIYALLPFQPYLVYNYKTAWKNRIELALVEAKSIHGTLPFFDKSCIFAGYRRSTRLVDQDGLSSCFKCILDDLRYQYVAGKILHDDNPKLIVSTPCFQITKGQHQVGFRLEKLDDWVEPTITDEDFLTLNSESFLSSIRFS